MKRPAAELALRACGSDANPDHPGHGGELRVAAARQHGTGAEAERSLAEHATPPSAAPGPRLIVAHDPYNPHSETVRALRTELLLRHDAPGRADAVALLSPDPGEGRSQLAAELAVSFAQLGRRTLLVDTDLRRPRQHELFGINNGAGLAEALARNHPTLLHPVKGLRQMFLLNAGRPPPNPLELLSDGRFECLVEQWRGEFEFMVFDAPPLSECADGLAIATIVGRVLTLSRANHTSFRNLSAMRRRLAATQAQILGGVINHF